MADNKQASRSMKEKLKEIGRYIIIGFATTIINWAVQIVLTELVHADGENTSNWWITAVEWIVSTLFFAFWAYKFFVFRSKSMKKDMLVPEFVSFTGARLVTFFIELAIMTLFCDLLGFNDKIMLSFSKAVLDKGDAVVATKLLFEFGIREEYVIKLFACVIITILNYIFSKLVIFKKGQYSGSDSGNEPETEAADDSDEIADSEE